MRERSSFAGGGGDVAGAGGGPRRAALVPLLLLLSLLSFLVLPGCARPGAHEARAEGGRIVLRFWNGFTGPDGKTMEALVRRFRAEHPGIDVRMQIIPWGTYYDKLTLSLAYGGAPDVFVIHAGRLPEYASFDVLRPLGDLFARSGLAAEEFAPVTWAASHYQDRLLALPLDVHPIGLYYNTRLFREAGIVDAQGNPAPPRDWDEFLRAAKKLTRDTDGDGRPDQWGFAFTFLRTNWQTFAAQFGGGILTPGGECALDSPESLAATHRMRSLIYEHRVAPKPEGIDAWLAFRQGKVAMALEGIYMLASLEEQKGLPFAGAPAPRFGPKPRAWGGSHLLAMPAEIAPERARAAWAFMRFLSDHSLEWAAGGQVPVRRELLATPEFRSLEVQAEFAKQLGGLDYDPAVPKANALYQFVDPAIEAVLLNLETPEEAMRDACRRIEQVLERP